LAPFSHTRQSSASIGNNHHLGRAATIEFQAPDRCDPRVRVSVAVRLESGRFARRLTVGVAVLAAAKEGGAIERGKRKALGHRYDAHARAPRGATHLAGRQGRHLAQERAPRAAELSSSAPRRGTWNRLINGPGRAAAAHTGHITPMGPIFSPSASFFCSSLNEA
jgi:hypothetical protein